MGKEDTNPQLENPLPKLSQDEVAEGLTLRIKNIEEKEIEGLSKIDKIGVKLLGGPPIKKTLNRIFFSAMNPTSPRARELATTYALGFRTNYENYLNDPNLDPNKKEHYEHELKFWQQVAIFYSK